MGFCQGTCRNTTEPPNSSTCDALSTSTIIAKDHCFDYDNELKLKGFLSKMFWKSGLACFLPSESDETIKKSNNRNGNLEHNKAWLLAESGGCGSGSELTNTDPHSVHSSFRFSLCSQVELESMKMNSSASATVLLVNLDNGLNETRTKELKWRRIQSLERSISPVANSLVRFSYSEILAATNNFSKGRVLGRGALSFVFRGKVGFLRTVVAIKRLDKEDKEASKAFCRELMIASSLYHSNIVPLVGFCIDPEEGLFLVYKYVSGGSLERHLHDKKVKGGVKGSPGLSWSVRYKVALGIAQAIAYLHNGTERCVVHRDIKPSNILLSSKKVPKVRGFVLWSTVSHISGSELCDFGLATWTSAPSIPFLCKTVKGTFGYEKRNHAYHGLCNLLQAKPLLQKGKGAIEELLDPQLQCTLRNTTQIIQMIQAATACVSNEESRRPGIDEIIGILSGKEQPIYSNRKKSNFSGIIDCYPQLQQTKSEMNSHLALAMLGVSEFEDDDHLYCR
ncbi:hypothetical protein SADUNF_Sadunf17G0116400 [Salix dunnii]|uniref:Protein kinase domain-containing protein n=1 Tax=Salix dunnii TaxID=1413687 RepID=A0A835MKB5_9ROSI|nr:hypothetical protein SADUNF_Sadunf17G0116400 [Salix dunnii]